MSYCDDFKHGFCEIAQMHVPKSYCGDLCSLRNLKTAEEVPAKPKPTLETMAASFAKAMTKWAGSGFKLVEQDEYVRRRTICNTCGSGWRCPKCGCMLWAKAAIKTEECEKWNA